MIRLSRRFAWLTLSTLGLAACGESTTPLQPDASADPALSAVSLALAPNTWTPRTPPPGPELLGLVAGVAPNASGQPIVYTFGGHDRDATFNGFSVQAYNAATDTWGVGGGAGPIPVSDANGVGKIGNRLYLTGGRTYGDDFMTFKTTWAYEPSTNRLFNKADMPLATADGVTGVIGTKLYVLPGSCSGFTSFPPPCSPSGQIRQLYRYDPATNQWTTRRAAPHFHSGGAGGVIFGKFYVVGGMTPSGLVADLDVYDPATNTWKTLAPSPATGEGRTVAAVLQNKLFVVTWRRGSDEQVVIRMDAYNPKTNTWSTRAPPPVTGELVRVIINGRGHLLLLNSSDVNRGTYLYTP